MDAAFFDSCLLLDAPHAPHGNMIGALAYGNALEARAAGLISAEPLNCIVGPNDPRYPKTANVVDLLLNDSALIENLKEAPAHWWPLCGAARQNASSVILHLNASNFSSLARGVTRLARAFPAVRMIVDPFHGGKASKWQAGVCLAEEPNIWITTRGLYGTEHLWPDRSEREALHFTVGEVGAGKLLFASGMTHAQLNAQAVKPGEWLERVDFLDRPQRELILHKNAAELFAPSAISPSR